MFSYLVTFEYSSFRFRRNYARYYCKIFIVSFLKKLTSFVCLNNQTALTKMSVQHFLNSFDSFGWYEYKFSTTLNQFSFAEYGNLNALIQCAQPECLTPKKFALSAIYRICHKFYIYLKYEIKKLYNIAFGCN